VRRYTRFQVCLSVFDRFDRFDRFNRFDRDTAVCCELRKLETQKCWQEAEYVLKNT
jgi:hypothetical protein